MRRAAAFAESLLKFTKKTVPFNSDRLRRSTINGQVRCLSGVARIIPWSCHSEDSHNAQKSLPSSVRDTTTARFHDQTGFPDNSSGQFTPSSHKEEILLQCEHNLDDRGNPSGRSSRESGRDSTLTSDYEIAISQQSREMPSRLQAVVDANGGIALTER
jgi:hypothetical protein